MTFSDTVRYAFGNLRKTRLRTALTAAGVSIGIGAMTSMVSVGVGTQRNVLEQVNRQNILTTITVTSSDRQQAAQQGPVEGQAPGRVRPRQGGRAGFRGAIGDTARTGASGERAVLDAGAVERLRGLWGVRDAYPSITVPGMLGIGELRDFMTLQAMPARILADQTVSKRVSLLSGRVYEEGVTDQLVLSRRSAEALVPGGASIDTLIGQRVVFVVLRSGEGSDPTGLLEGIDLPPAFRNLPIEALLRGMTGDLFETVRLDLEIVGIVEGVGTFGDFLGTALYVPVETVEPYHAGVFRNLESLLSGESGSGAFSSVNVIAEDVGSVRRVQQEVRELGYRAASLLDELDEIRRAFAVVNGFLALLGGVSLIVAAMMIVNTLVMAVLERTREIGLLKSLGATNAVVARLFLTEAAAIGLLGGVGGLILGSAVAHVTNLVANVQMMRNDGFTVDIVSFPPWLILGAIAFAVLVSLAAGFYPARRASRVDPVVALRHF